jgi:hypothetical protein
MKIKTSVSVLFLLAATLCASPLSKFLAAQDATTGGPAHLKNELSSLQFFSGSWGCKGTFPASGKTIESHITFTPDLDGAWLSMRHDDIPPNRFHALELWGWDAKQSQFSATIFDNFGGARHFTSPGFQDQTLTWNADTVAPSTTPAERFVFRKDSATQFTVNWEVNRDSAWKIGDTLTCTH